MEDSIPGIFLKNSQTFKNKTALLYKKSGVYFPITYKELAKKIIDFSLALEKLGVEKGDRVAILSENRPEWVVSDMASMMIGAISVPCHATFNPSVIQNILNHCKAKILIVSNRNLLNKVIVAEKNADFLKKIIFMEKLTSDLKEIFHEKIISWENLFENILPRQSEHSDISPDDICTIIYTSGTTGIPKGVELSHKNFISNAMAVSKAVPVKKSDVFLSFLPLSHVLERMAGCYMPLFFGATIAYAEGAKQLPNNLKEVKPTILISVPRIFEKFEDAIWDKVNKSKPLSRKFFLWAISQKRRTLRYKIADFLVFKKIRKQMGGHLRLAISGGASLNEKIARFFYKIGIKIIEGYGLTETSPVISVNRERDFEWGTVGRAIEGVEIKISKDKEIFVKGPNVAKGYYKNQKETDESFLKDGWFCTGDLGFIDRYGFLTIIGRKKEMIVTSNGKNIWPEPIENLLNKDKYISQSMIVGDNRRFISALIVPDWDEVMNFLKQKKMAVQSHEKLIKDPKIIQLFQNRMDQKINTELSDFEKIRRFKLIDSEFSQERAELTPTLKLRRYTIFQHHQKEIEEMYE